MMFRWVLFVFLALIFLSWLFSKRLPWLEKLGLTSFNSSLDFSFREAPRLSRRSRTISVLTGTDFQLLRGFIQGNEFSLSSGRRDRHLLLHSINK